MKAPEIIKKCYRMTRKTILCKQENIRIQLCAFGTPKGVTEYQLLFSATDVHLPFERQLSDVQEAYRRTVKNELKGGCTAVFRRYFLSDAANQAEKVTEADEELFPCAVSVVQQPPLDGTKIALWAYLLTDMASRLHATGLLEAAHNGYRHFWSAGLCNRATNPEYQTRLLLNDYILALGRQQATLASDCIRTWFFVQNVDVNYPGVVRARREVFYTQNLTENTHYIASTGIEGRHADPAVRVHFDAYAVKGLQPEQTGFLYAPEHLNPTYEYGVTFERGTTVTYGDRRHLFISGTASIDNHGEVVHPGNVLKQAERMFGNIEALLNEGGASLDDVSEAVVYLRDPSDYAAVSRYMEQNHPGWPHLIVLAPVCRPGWLIETECMAVIPARTEFPDL